MDTKFQPPSSSSRAGGKSPKRLWDLYVISVASIAAVPAFLIAYKVMGYQTQTDTEFWWFHAGGPTVIAFFTAFGLIVLGLLGVLPSVNNICRWLGHRQNGCRCEVCFAENWHQWEFCKCRICGEQQSENHNWKGCHCLQCGTVRNLNHTWDGCVCSICATRRNVEHAWDGCICSRCNARRDAAHMWVACQCSKCNAVVHTFNEWAYQKPDSCIQVRTCQNCSKVLERTEHIRNESGVCKRCNQSEPPPPDSPYPDDYPYDYGHQDRAPLSTGYGF